MFWAATLFNCNISKWDVFRVANVNDMFMGAKSFNQQLYGFTWVHSMATKTRMFELVLLLLLANRPALALNNGLVLET